MDQNGTSHQSRALASNSLIVSRSRNLDAVISVITAGWSTTQFGWLQGRNTSRKRFQTVTDDRLKWTTMAQNAAIMRPPGCNQGTAFANLTYCVRYQGHVCWLAFRCSTLYVK